MRDVFPNLLVELYELLALPDVGISRTGSK
jgi:hypothetical protein